MQKFLLLLTEIPVMVL